MIKIREAKEQLIKDKTSSLETLEKLRTNISSSAQSRKTHRKKKKFIYVRKGQKKGELMKNKEVMIGYHNYTNENRHA